MPYTIAQLDRAMEVINKRQIGRGAGWSRPIELTHAATFAWMMQHPEDEHTAAVREALLDLQKTGALQPEGGWPSDDR